jgi:hypothetical protein
MNDPPFPSQGKEQMLFEERLIIIPKNIVVDPDEFLMLGFWYRIKI